MEHKKKIKEELRSISMDIMERLKDIASMDDTFIVFIVGKRRDDDTINYLDFSNANDELHKILLKATSDDHEFGRTSSEKVIIN